MSKDLNTFIKSVKRQNKRGRCYHPDAGQSCNKFIGAHSIQESKELKSIANEKNEVIQIKNFPSTKEVITKSKKVGIGVVSTFKGFCESHDSIFKPIDDYNLRPTDEQVFLFAFRSVCKEIFVKENAINNLLVMRDETHKNDIIESLLYGNKVGLENLYKHKILFDSIFNNKQYSSMRYYFIEFNSKPTFHFSGLIYPDYDFNGNSIQNILHNPELLTYCSAITDNGWGILFSWIDKENSICIPFIQSIENNVYNGGDLSNLLFNFVVSRCENLAFSPIWWKDIGEEVNNKIVNKIIKRNRLDINFQANEYKEYETLINDFKFKKVNTNILW